LDLRHYKGRRTCTAFPLTSRQGIDAIRSAAMSIRISRRWWALCVPEIPLYVPDVRYPPGSGQATVAKLKLDDALVKMGSFRNLGLL
jgi:hypothetical protein